MNAPLQHLLANCLRAGLSMKRMLVSMLVV
jgi:hypothetical protein